MTTSMLSQVVPLQMKVVAIVLKLKQWNRIRIRSLKIFGTPTLNVPSTKTHLQLVKAINL